MAIKGSITVVLKVKVVGGILRESCAVSEHELESV